MKEVKNYENYIIYENGTIYSKKNKKYLKQQLNHKGYPVVKLCKNGVQKEFFIHRLVAMHYIPNPKNKPQINHKNGNKLINCVSNLEWVTNKENIAHAWEFGLSKSNPEISKANGLNSAKKLIDINTNKIYNSIKEAADDLNIKYGYLRLIITKYKHRTSLKYI